MPTAPFQTYTNAKVVPAFDPKSALMKHCNLVQGTYAPGTLIGELTATPGTFKAYAAASVDGSEVPCGILPLGCIVDAQGNINLGGDLGGTTKSVEYYIAGYFQTQDLVGLDAEAIAAMNARLVSGTIASGVLKF